MDFSVDLQDVFETVLQEYDRISPFLLSAEFEKRSETNLVRVRSSTPREMITLDALSSFNRSGSPKLNLSGQEQHSLIVPVMCVLNLLDACTTSPRAEILSAKIEELVDYKRTSAGALSNALTYYLTAKAIIYVGELTGEGSGNVDLSPLERALGITPQ